MDGMETETKLYEIAYLITPSIADEAARDFHQSIKSRAQELGGLIDHEGEVYRRKLSYPIKKMTEAYVAHFRAMVPKAKTGEIKSSLEQESVLRFLMVYTQRVIPRPASIGRTIKTPRTETQQPQQPIMPKAPPIDENAIKEIDKKLEEILGA